MVRPIHNLILKDKKYLTDQTLSLLFECRNSDFQYVAGQFISVQLVIGDKILKRSYSIATPPETFKSTGQFEIAITLISDGVASQFFQQTAVGCELQMTGPFGALVLPEIPPKRLILVGTGTGMSPYRSMLPKLGKFIQQGVIVHIIMGVRKKEDLFYHQEFSEFSISNANVIFIKCLSREKSVLTGSGEFLGRVTDLLKDVVISPSTDLIYLCGNPEMVDDAMHLLEQQNLPLKNIKREKYTQSR